MNTTSTVGVPNDDKDIIDAGYRPELHRGLKFFSSFAFSFSNMSILMGIFTNFAFVLTIAGPFGFWTWLMVAAGQFIVCLVFAEMAARIPLTGSLYNWNYRLGGAWIGSLVAWCSAFAYALSGAAIMVGMIAAIQSLLGITFSAQTANMVAFAIFALQFGVNVYGVRLAALVNRVAVIAEIIAIVVFGALLALILAVKGGAHPEFLTTIPSSPVPYLPAFLMASLLAAWTIFGFEAASDLSEETIAVKTVAPKSIISSVLVSAIMGFAFITILTLAIPNLADITNSSAPIASILTYHLGTVPTQLFLVCAIVAMFATSLLAIAFASRLMFAAARDEHFIAARFFRKISSRKVPANASIAVVIIEILAFGFASGLAALFAATVVLLYVAYLITVVNFARSSQLLPPTKNFSLGKWARPVAIVAALWLSAAIAILTVPKDFNLAGLTAGGVIIFGLLQYAVVKYWRGT